MESILILGGYGYTGRSLARHLSANTDFQIILAGRQITKAQELANQINNPRVSARQIDAADPASMRAGLRGVDFLLVAAPLTSAPPEIVIQAALEASVDYLDIQLGSRKYALLQSLEPEILRKKLCFITEAGFHPGLPAAMARFAALQMDSLENIITAGYLNMSGANLAFTPAVDELMEIFKDYQAQTYKDGRWTKANSFELKKVDFGGEIGLRRGYSLFFEELRCLPEMYPSLRNLGFYISETHWVLDWVINLLVMAGLKLAPRRGVRPLGRLMWWGMQRFGKPPRLLALMVEAEGTKNSRKIKLHSRMEHADGYELTAIPVAAFLMQYNQIRRPGLHLMGHLAEPLRLFQDMESLGVRITTSIH